MSPYGYHWRTVIRPEALRMAGGTFSLTGEYMGGALCARCQWKEPELDGQPKSRLEVAHLDGNVTNDEEDNLAVLCVQCHRSLDYPLWSKRCRETRSLRKDRLRPLLQEIA